MQRQEKKADIKAFHHNVEADFFVPVARLMINKWKEIHGENKTKSLIDYFTKQWLSPRRKGL